jgi:hypothetical protein
MNIENTQSQMKKGILEFCILSIIRRGEAYPSDIVEEMRNANMSILEGTLYPLLTRLKKATPGRPVSTSPLHQQEKRFTKNWKKPG